MPSGKSRPFLASIDRHPGVAVAGVTLLALALRLFRIDAQGAWLDEVFTIHAGASAWHDMVRILVDDFNHPPLHTVLVRGWFDLFHVGVVQARLLSAIFGTLAVPALYWFGTLLFDRRTALLASVLLAMSQLGIVYSQEARGYSLLLLLVIGAGGFFIRAFRSGRVSDFACFVAASILALYTHYYAVFALAGLLVFALMYRRRSAIPAWWWPAALGLTIVAYLPWLTSGVIDSVLRNPRGAVDDKLFAPILSPLYALNWFNNGKLAGVRISAPWWTFPLGCLVFTTPAFYALRRMRAGDDAERQAAWLLTLGCVVPVLAVSSLGILHLIYDVRHVSFVVAAYYLIVARGVTFVRSSTARRVIVAVIIGYTALSFRADYFIAYKENYRDALRVVAAQSRAGDCTIFGAPDRNSFGGLYWDSYYHGQSPPAIIGLDEAPARSDCRRVWLVWDTMWWKAGPLTYPSVQAQLAAVYRPGEHWSFAGVDVQLFAR